MVTIVSQCFGCKHFDERWAETEGLTKPYYRCKAFDRIPRSILFNETSHKKPYPGDKGIRFEPKE